MGDRREDPPALYPLFLDLTGRSVLVVGGGAVAERRVAALLEAAASVSVVAPEATPGLQELARARRIEWLGRRFAVADVGGRALVFSATGDCEVDEKVSAAGRALHIPVNVADDVGLSDFHVPAVVRRGAVQAAVSTGGSAPGLAGRLRDRLSQCLGPAWGPFARLLGEVRDHAKRTIVDPGQRMEAMRRLAYDDALLADVARGAAPAADEVLARVLPARRPDAAPPEAGVSKEPRRGFVSIVGAGPGDPDLVTRAGLERLAAADVVIYDDLVDRRLLGEAPKTAELVYHGKRGWRGGSGRDAATLAEKAREGTGKRVVRLKGGDPFVFGRLDEEIEALIAADVPFEVMPGVTAASGAAATALLPLTKRAVSAHLTFVAGVGADDIAGRAEEIAPFLLERGGTVALYMGLRRLGDFTHALLDAGVAPSLPAVVVSQATTPQEHVVRGTVLDIAEQAGVERLASPAVALFGEALCPTPERPG